jgi:dihydropteroate synthase
MADLPFGPAGVGATPDPLVVRGRTFAWGERTYVMGIINVTPDSFSGDGLLGGDAGPRDHEAVVRLAVEQARQMIVEGADILDVGGESTRPGHAAVGVGEEIERVVAIVAAIRSSPGDIVLSIDTTKPAVAAAALAAGADIINDVAGAAPNDEMASLAATSAAPYIMSHAWTEARSGDVLPAVVADLERAVARAGMLGCERGRLLVDPGFGFGKTPAQNLALLRGLGRLRALGLPVLLGASRKSTIGHVLGLPAEERLEGTLATTALGIAAGCDIIRVHDVLANVRAARMSDAIVRGRWPPGS